MAEILHELLSKYVSFFDLVKDFDYRGYSFWEEGMSKVEKNYQMLFEDREFENLLSHRALLLMVSNGDCEQLILTAKEIIQLIEKELNQC